MTIRSLQPGNVESGGMSLTVEDDGPGIPADKREAVLSAYTRLEQDEGEVRGGFGLGLAIVKRVMDLHEGAVTIETADRGGAKISLAWPV